MTSLPPILPDGTQVVTHVDILASSGNVLFAKGAVGVIVKAPVDTTHAYRVRFMYGSEHSLKAVLIADYKYSPPRRADVPSL
ncbi:MAG: hypothetical protein KC708_11455 [Anaerolineae bacterium]|nr:hypothetical protein [Anaerolineae bacterium]